MGEDIFENEIIRVFCDGTYAIRYDETLNLGEIALAMEEFVNFIKHSTDFINFHQNLI